MTNIQEILYRYLNLQLRLMVFSGARSSTGASRIKVRPVVIREKLLFQCASTVGTKEFHENLEREQAVCRLEEWIRKDFRQLQIDSESGSVTVLVSKKGKITVKEKKKQRGKEIQKKEPKESRELGTACGGRGCEDESPESQEARMRRLSHNRKKRYILEEGKPVDFLVDLGVMTREGKIVHARYDKFRQINRFLEFIEDILPRLPRDREITILDFVCGKSYLTFAMYYYLRELKRYDVKIVGLDLKEDVIVRCQELADRYGYDKLRFCQGDIASYEGVSRVDMVVTLHACDTATDFALAKAVGWGASVILSVPCCQHELNRQISNDVMQPVFAYGVLKERIAALMTDGLRAQMLEMAGYETQILEFIDMEHTPKNLLIRAVYTGKKKENGERLRACLDAYHLHPTLEGLLFQGGMEK